ncbi:hypothetical protein N0B40_02095 [Chryseobacterium oranimense]|uniref:hypothetical protein n=1 Tax=Chryseobacterium oranimense TaxID=421058 RepID=UPI0021B055AF|nr:hypothetical protein [Chryseobacterium oranimense]UWX61072.1 hypothetical protein N0B40_02095 [Chryseobacterium oranimense]
MTTLDPLRQILSFQASRNNPGANYYYEFGIVPFEHSIHPSDFMRSHFHLQYNDTLTVHEISESGFKKAIYNWFFECERSKNTNTNPSENTEYVESFYQSLASVTRGKRIYHFQNVNEGHYEYQLGIYFDYFYIEGEENNFLVYFSMQD